jgi:small GTP-binding protein
MNNNEYLLKICAIGSWDVGKTPLIRRYAENKFDTNYLPTLGVDITTKKIILDETQVKLIIVDTAGQEFFGKLRPSYYRGASACVVFFNKNNRESFVEIPNWVNEFLKYIQPIVPLALVGITSDSNVVSTKEAKELAKSLNLHYFECQSKTCPLLVKVFAFLARKVIKPASFREDVSVSLRCLVTLYLTYLFSRFLQILIYLADIIQGRFSQRKDSD